MKWILVGYSLRQGKRSAEGSKVNRNPQATRYCNGFDQRVARQRLCKHGPTRNNK
jgi:hypothetical protein